MDEPAMHEVLGEAVTTLPVDEVPPSASVQTFYKP